MMRFDTRAQAERAVVEFHEAHLGERRVLCVKAEHCVGMTHNWVGNVIEFTGPRTEPSTTVNAEVVAFLTRAS
jgi:hypothetical protein